MRWRELSAEVFKPVAAQVLDIWNNAGIPSMGLKGVQRKVSDCYNQYQKFNKIRTINRHKPKTIALEKARIFFGKLFEIAQCRCQDLRQCSCAPDRKLSESQISFLSELRRSRQMTLGEIDRSGSPGRETATSGSLVRPDTVGNASQSWMSLGQGQAEGPLDPGSLPGTSDDGQNGHNEVADSDSQDVNDVRGSDTQDAEDGDSDTQDVTMSDQNCPDPRDSSGAIQSDSATVSKDSATIPAGYSAVTYCGPLIHTAMAANRFSLSNQAVAAVINAFQLDIGRGPSENPLLLLDPQKLWKERRRLGRTSAKARARQAKAVRSNSRDDSNLQSQYFDGRKDTHTSTGGSAECSEEHIAAVAEPGENTSI